MQTDLTGRAASRLNHLTEIIPPLLKNIPEEVFSFKPRPEKWSKKQIIGHLVDSATNNHHRLIRARIEEQPFISYDQVKWNRISNYNDMNSASLIELWTIYNKFIAKLIKEVPSEDLDRICRTGQNETHALSYIIEDYVSHLEHHLRQVVEY